MKPFKTCPVCSGELENKQVKRRLKVKGGVVLYMGVDAEVCLHCGKMLFAEDVIKLFVALSTGEAADGAMLTD